MPGCVWGPTSANYYRLDCQEILLACFHSALCTRTIKSFLTNETSLIVTSEVIVAIWPDTSESSRRRRSLRRRLVAVAKAKACFQPVWPPTLTTRHWLAACSCTFPRHRPRKPPPPDVHSPFHMLLLSSGKVDLIRYVCVCVSCHRQVRVWQRLPVASKSI